MQLHAFAFPIHHRTEKPVRSGQTGCPQPRWVISAHVRVPPHLWSIVVLAADWEHCKDVTSAFNVPSRVVTPDPIETGTPRANHSRVDVDVDVEDVHDFGVKILLKKEKKNPNRDVDR